MRRADVRNDSDIGVRYAAEILDFAWMIRAHLKNQEVRVIGTVQNRDG